MALEVIEQFELPRDRRSLLQHNEDKIAALAESPARNKLFEILKEDGGPTLAYKQEKKNFAALLKSRNLEQLEIMLSEFYETPSRHLSRVIQVMELYRDLNKPEEVHRWLDRVVESGREYRSSDKELLDLFVQMDRVEDAMAYFGPRKAVANEQYKDVPLEKQPLAALAMDYAKQGRLELAEQVVNAIEEPTWRSGSLAALSIIVREDLPSLAQEWWADSLRVLDEVDRAKLHDMRLKRNGMSLLVQNRFDEALEILARFNEHRRAANALAAWTTQALEKNDDLSETVLRRCIDRVAELDPRELEAIVSHFIDEKDVQNCVYVAMRLKEDTDVEYFSYILYDMQLVFELARDTITNEQIKQIFDFQLPKHRAAVMACCLKAFEKHERLEEIIPQVLRRIDDCDANLTLHNTLMRIFIEQGDLQRLRELLDRKVPDSQFLDDDPVANSWRVNNRYAYAPERLVKKIGGTEMLKFANSLKLAAMRKAANAQALFQLTEDQGIAQVQPICNEIADPGERADTWLLIIDRYLTPPKFDGK